MTRAVAGVSLWKWLALAVGVVLVIVAIVAGGSSSAANVAKVSGKKITLADYNAWLQASATSAHAEDADLPSFVPDAPNYTRCIAFEQAAAAKAKAKTTTASLKNGCRELRISLAEGTMQLLLTGQWILDQADREGLTVPDSQVQSSLHKSFPKSSGLTSYLSTNKLSRDQLEFEVRVALTSEKIDTKHGGAVPTISQSEIESYYNKYKSQLNGATLAQATSEIKEALIQQAQAPKLDPYLQKLQTYWKARTTCARGYRLGGYCSGI